MIYLIILIPFLGSILGSLSVFFIKEVNSKLSKFMYGFSAGVMIAAAIFSLLVPAMDLNKFNSKYNNEFFLILLTTLGLICGFLFMIFMEKVSGKILDKRLINSNSCEMSKESNRYKRLKRSILLFIAITVHNIPEGIVTGIGLVDTSNLFYAFSLALGIAIQNIPEGVISSVPFREETGSNLNAFILGTLSGIIEPIFGIITLKFVSCFISITPFILTFAAGCMIFVVLKELIPNCLGFEINNDDNECEDESNIGMISFLVGFIVMMILDVVLA